MWLTCLVFAMLSASSTSILRKTRGRQQGGLEMGNPVHQINYEEVDEDEEQMNKMRRISWEIEYPITVAQLRLESNTNKATFQQVDCRYPMYDDDEKEFSFSIDNGQGGRFRMFFIFSVSRTLRAFLTTFSRSVHRQRLRNH